MQISSASSSSIALLPVAVTPRRDDVVESAAEKARKQQLAANQVASQSDQPFDREVTRIRTRASAAAQQANSQTQESLRDLPARQRGALQSYLSNGPSIQERLGVELAGIDVFA